MTAPDLAVAQVVRRGAATGLDHATSRPVEDHDGAWVAACSCGGMWMAHSERTAFSRAWDHVVALLPDDHWIGVCETCWCVGVVKLVDLPWGVTQYLCRAGTGCNR